MKLIKYYFNKEFIPSILFGLFFYTTLFLITSFIEILELSLKNGIPFLKASYIIFLSFPFILTTTIPMAMFFGVILSLAKLQSQNEIFAFYSLGLSKKIFYKEIFRISLIFFLIHIFISFYLLPRANRNLVQYRIQLLQSGVSKNIEPRTFIKAFPQKVIYIKNLKNDKKYWEYIFIADYSQPNISQYIYAKEGELFLNPEGNQIWLKIYDTVTLALKDEKSFQKNTSKEQNILLFPPIKQTNSYKFGAREKGLKELYKDFKNENQYIRNRSKVEFNKRFVLPSLSMIFPFLALAISLRKRERGSVKGYAFLVSLIVILTAYLFIIYNESLAVEGKMDPYISMWIIPAFFFFITALLIILPQRDKKAKFLPLFKKKKRETIKTKERKVAFSFYLLDFYLLKSFIPYFILSILAISSLYIILDFAQLVEEINKNKLSFYSILSYYFYALPQSLYDYIIPISILFSVSIGFAVLERNKEITALRGLGVSFLRIFSSFLIFIIFIALSVFIFSEIYLPLNNQKFEEYKSIIFGKTNVPKIVKFFGQDTFIASDKGWIYKYKAFEKKNNSIIGFEGFNFEQEPQLFISADELFFQDKRWIATKGIERKIFNGKIEFKKLENEEYEIPDKPETFSSLLDSPNNLNILKLKSYISNLKKAGHKPSNWEVKLYQKLFYPLFIIILGFISILSSFSSKTIYHIWGNLAKTLFVGIIYWILMIFFVKMGEMQILSPFLSAFSPNFLALIFGVYYYLGIKN
jgi:lipopolysaccharide export system permease protein